MNVRTFPLGPLETNCFVIHDAEQAVIVDPGGDPDILKDGDELMLTQPAVVLEQLIGKFLFNAGSEKDKDAAPQPPASDGSNP